MIATTTQEYIQQGQESGRLETARQIASQLLKLPGVVTMGELTGPVLEEVKALAKTEPEGEN